VGELQDQVQEFLDELVACGAEDGLQAAVYRRGELMVDAVAGSADPGTDRPVTPDTLFYAASTAKGVTATVVHVLVQRGLFGYDTPIVELWPEFGARGKHTGTVRHALTHSLGVPALPVDLTWARLADWDAMCALVADLQPWYEPGAQTGYHAMTYGFVLGEVVRRATGRPIAQVLAEDVAGPLGVADELFFGVPQAAAGRLARFVDGDDVAMFAELPDDFPMFRFGPRAFMPTAELINDTDLVRYHAPAMGTMSARAVARMYAALLDEVDGVRLVSPDRLAEISTVATTGTDQTFGGPASYGLGYSVGRIGHLTGPPSVFGAAGVGGSAAYADPATGVSVAVTKNRFTPTDLTAFTLVQELALEEFR
jgi:CubicO group peptidase (beta-lactamase class C family)